jgi:hypothetical protein
MFEREAVFFSVKWALIEAVILCICKLTVGAGRSLPALIKELKLIPKVCGLLSC